MGWFLVRKIGDGAFEHLDKCLVKAPTDEAHMAVASLSMRSKTLLWMSINAVSE